MLVSKGHTERERERERDREKGQKRRQGDKKNKTVNLNHTKGARTRPQRNTTTETHSLPEEGTNRRISRR